MTSQTYDLVRLHPDQQKNGGGPGDKAAPKAPRPKAKDAGGGNPAPDKRTAGLPRGFHRDKGRKGGPQAGIYYQDGGEPQFVCGPLNILGRVRDPESQSWARLLQWHDPDGVEHIASVSDAKLHGDMSSLCGELATQGLKISTSPQSRTLFVRMLNNAHPDKRITIVERTGWHNLKGADVFVLPEQGIGAGDVILAKSVSHAYQQQGSLEEWKSAIASKAVGNTRLIFAISMALTPPLLSPCGWESGGFHLRHQSSTGKTTTLRVAASAFGGPPNIRSWRATSNGLEGVAAAHCDSLLVLDELSQVSPREAGQIAYMLANGSGKSRANREGGARAVAKWRLLFLSSGEIALAEKVAEDGRGRATAGQQIRIVDVPSNLEHGLFENLHGHESGQAFADHMTAVSSQYYGTAAPVFIEKLLTEPDKGKSLADSICQKFLQSIPDAHGQVARVAHRFAIVAAAGEIGMRHSILPWPDDAAIDGVHACFKSWFEAWGGPGAIELRAGIDQVRAFFELHGESRFEPFYGSADRPVHNRAGFRKTAEEACEWFVLPKVWREEVCRGFDMVNLNRELIRLKILIPGDGNKASSPHKIAALGSVVKRLYHITDAVIEGDTD